MEASELIHEVSEPVEPAEDREGEAAGNNVRNAPEPTTTTTMTPSMSRPSASR